MLNVESYKPKKSVARKTPRGFSKATTPKSDKPRFDIKSDPKVIFRAAIYTGTTIALIGLIVFSAYKIIRWQAEKDLTDQQIIALQEHTEVKEIKVINSDFPALMSVDLSSLQGSNPDTVGWINVPGTNINYPFVQTDNNNYYLKHSFNRYWSEAGWVFLDYRNSKELNNQNQIIYAHGRVDGSMFGSLSNVLTKEWQNNPNNHYVKISTASADMLWQVISTYQITKTDDYLITNFNNSTHFYDFINMILARSNYNYNQSIDENDKLLTLSTCVGATDRAVLHAKLVKLIEK